MISVLFAICSLLITSIVTASSIPTKSNTSQHANDTHYTDVGFFDIHVCNWPDRKLFFMPLFSTTHYPEVADIKVYYPDGKLLTSMDLARFKLVKIKGKPEKHVIMKQVDVPDGAVNGWYSATVSMTDGTKVTAKDYVIVSRLPRPSIIYPPDGAEQIPIPGKLTWSGVKKGYYKVYIRDVWDDGKLIYTSKLLSKPELAIPSSLLQPGGLYSWKVNARDVNEDILLGDFNKGSMSIDASFSIADK
jgi:hypothetical protein